MILTDKPKVSIQEMSEAGLDKDSVFCCAEEMSVKLHCLLESVLSYVFFSTD